MTKINEVDRIGPVVVTEIVAEFLPTPTKYMLDCDFVVECEWGMSPIESLITALQHAKDHADFHEKHGEKSKAWQDQMITTY